MYNDSSCAPIAIVRSTPNTKTAKVPTHNKFERHSRFGLVLGTTTRLYERTKKRKKNNHLFRGRGTTCVGDVVQPYNVRSRHCSYTGPIFVGIENTRPGVLLKGFSFSSRPNRRRAEIDRDVCATFTRM